MFNRSEIMKAAWAHYRNAKAYAAGNPFLTGTVVRFGDCLKEEWRRAKAALTSIRAVSAAVSEQVTALRNAIQNLNYKSFRYSITSERRILDAKLTALVGECA